MYTQYDVILCISTCTQIRAAMESVCAPRGKGGGGSPPYCKLPRLAPRSAFALWIMPISHTLRPVSGSTGVAEGVSIDRVGNYSCPVASGVVFAATMQGGASDLGASVAESAALELGVSQPASGKRPGT